jgi:DNA-binding winged helix-turn-helix (wHTH) protein/tetratricopeptide (TPR) repeat protein
MNNGINNLREFGKFRLDAKKKVLWFENEPVGLQLKEIELLCVLTENGGEVVTKDELFKRVWENSFVEESNLSRHIYRIRKTFTEFGESADLIQTVPRRGYRWTGEIHESGNAELIIERHSISRTLIEEIEDSVEPKAKVIPAQVSQPELKRYLIPAVIGLVILTTAFSFYFYNLPKPTANSPIKSLAVLPVKSLSAKTDDEELRWQITDALITKLGGVKEISVRPTASVLRFAKSEQTIFEIGKKLEVDAILDSRVQEEGETIRVTLQLVSVANGEQLWSEVFDGKTNQILGLQDRISARVLDSLNQNRQQALALTTRPTNNDDAYTAFLKGRYFAARSDEASLRKAIEYYKKAVELDANFALAYVGNADVYFRLYQGDYDFSVENVNQAKTNLDKAHALKPDLPEALESLGNIQNSYDWDWENAEKTFKKALELVPQSSAARLRYGYLLTALRRFDEAQNQIEQAIRLNPTSAAGYSHLGRVHFCKKDYNRAEEIFRKSLEMDEKWLSSHWYLSRVLWAQGRKAESFQHLVSGLRLDGNQPLGEQVEEKAKRETPEAVIKFLTEEWSKKLTKTNSVSLAARLMSLGERGKALDALEKSFNQRHPWLPMIAALPDFESLRSEPRFQDILRKMNLP